MATAYRKTPKGVAEVETRAHRLSPRMRNTLILVDGKRALETLESLVSQGLDENLQALMAGGFIEEVIVADRPRPAPPALPSTAPTAPAPDAEFLAVRREVVRFINEHLGPAGETMATSMERTRSAAELQPLLRSAAQLMHTVRGAQTANAFRARFIAG